MRRFFWIVLILMNSYFSFGQWCNKPNPQFCQGNTFQNGNFETVTGDPNASTDQDINLATGWQPMWRTGSLADLHCTGGSKSTGTAPTPNSGVYAGIWIENRTVATTTNPTFREGMYNRLATPIAQNSGFYSFGFNIANALLGGTQNNMPHNIGIYGVYNPSNILANAPQGANSNPTNINLWQSSSSSVQVVLLGIVTTPVPFSNTWIPQTVTFNSSILPAGGITHIMVTADDNARPDSYRKIYVNFDDFCLRKTEPPVAWCCPGDNLVRNGDFEAGNTGFTSQYTFNGATTTWATLPGQYNIVTGAQALAISSGWIAQDPGTCTNASGKFLAVNGATTGSGRRVIWEQTIPVKEWGRYKFCAYAKNLKQCTFDVKPKVDIEFSLPFGNLSETLNVSAGPCDWYKFEKGLDNWGYGTSLNIKIFLHESQPGDGNDLALDDIALIELPVCPVSAATFQITTQGVNAATYQVSATSATTPQCDKVWWKVCEWDMGANACAAGTEMGPLTAWGTANTAFPGYTFGYGKLYKITRGTWGDCHAWNQFDRYVGSSLRTKRITSYTQEQYDKNRTTILNSLK
ncbi:MAG: hypothetical protein KF852_06185 [Saprospiraceae bacterium]|nr:hypothetical protein [Saprospiraceae bacterium]